MCKTFLGLKKLFVLFLLMGGLKASAQVDYPVFKYGTVIQPTDSQRLSLNLYNLNYLHNTEWFGKIPLSGTLFGYQLIPELEYQVTPKFMLKAGLYLQQEFGRPNYTTVAPTFTAKYQARKTAFVFGTLEGGPNHGFIEPLYDYAWLINERLENGFQILTKTKYYEHDLYINWRRAIHPGDPFKEEFDIGYSSKFNLLDGKKWTLQIPFQFLYSHMGGQFDANTDPFVSLTDLAIGPTLTYNNDGRLLKKIHFDNYYVHYGDISTHKRQPFNSGNGFLSRLAFDLGDFAVDLRYWNGYKYIDPRGLSLFGSISQKDPSIIEKKRELLIASFIYDKQIAKNLFFDLRLIPYADFHENITTMTTGIKDVEYSYEMYLKYVMKINLAKIKNDLSSPVL